MRWPRLLLAVLALLFLSGLAAAGWGAGQRRTVAPAATPATALPSPTRAPVLAPAPGDAPAPEQARLATALDLALRDPGLGPGAAAAVVDAPSGNVLLARRAGVPLPPASTTKLATGVAALHVLGPQARLTTRTVLDGATVVLVGGGDPTLAGPRAPRTYPPPARLADLAQRTARALQQRGVRRVRLGLDTSRYTGPATAPGWVPEYVTQGDVAPVTALQVDGGRLDPSGRARYADPAGAAGNAFAALLRASGLVVEPAVRRIRAGPAAIPLAEVRSPPLPALVERMLTDSDNDLAEALARAVALQTGRPGSFAAAAAAVTAALAELGLDPAGLRLADGSGLSVRNAARPLLLARLAALVASPEQPRLRPALTGLPVAGFLGTLDERYRQGPVTAGAGAVRAKTGTLTGVSSLAGVVVDRDGRLLAFAFVAPRAPGSAAAAAALDRLAARLATCGCRP